MRRFWNLGCVLALTSTVAAAQPSVTQLWKARGLEANDSIARMEGPRRPRADASEKEKKDALEATFSALIKTDVEAAFTMMLEFAYSMHARSDAEARQMRKPSGLGDTYHLMLRAENGEILHLAFFYGRGTLQPSSIFVYELPKGWSVSMGSDIPNCITASGPLVSLGLCLEDPFHAVVMKTPVGR